jgi:NADH:ubiquinone oxidoreductase subunit 3 (subunit A)
MRMKAAVAIFRRSTIMRNLNYRFDKKCPFECGNVPRMDAPLTFELPASLYRRLSTPIAAR